MPSALYSHHRGHRITACTLTIALWLGAGALVTAPLPMANAQVQLPRLGDGADLTVSAERRLGDRIIGSLYRDPDYIDDPQLHAYVMDIWHPLVAAARQRGDLSDELHERFAWQILLGKDRSINAFALPGGYLGVHLGLIGTVSSKDELASVLAHELSHVTQRHIARMLSQDKKNMPLLLGSLILGALAAGSSPDAAQALILGGQAASVQNQLSFSRDMEREADRIGYNLLAPAGFSPQGTVNMFDKLQQASRLNDNGSWPYLRSHPLTSERIADMQARVQHGHGHEHITPATPTLEHSMMAARARVLSQPGVDRLRQWASQPNLSNFSTQDVMQQAGQLVAAALSCQQLRDTKCARKMWERLQTLVYQQNDAAAQRQTAWLGAELALAAEQPAMAQSLIEQAPALPERPRPALLLHSRTLLAQNAAAQAADNLQTWVTNHPQDALAWQLLAQARSAMNQPLQALRAEAEAYVAHLDYSAALDRLKAAQDLVQHGGAQVDYIEASIIDTRLRAVQDLLQTQMQASEEF